MALSDCNSWREYWPYTMLFNWKAKASLLFINWRHRWETGSPIRISELLSRKTLTRNSSLCIGLSRMFTTRKCVRLIVNHTKKVANNKLMRYVLSKSTISTNSFLKQVKKLKGPIRKAQAQSEKKNYKS